MTTFTWRYRCSICLQLIRPAEVGQHAEDEKAKPDWPGVIQFERVDYGAPDPKEAA